jgi:thiol-disulfide isomerase/thioredoxin
MAPRRKPLAPGTPVKKATTRRSGSQRPLYAAVGVFGVLSVVVALVLLLRPGSPEGGGAKQASYSTTAWSLPVLGGPGAVQLAAYKGKPTVANFFASWCTSCAFELPGFAKVSQELRGQVQFVGVNSLDDGSGKDMARHFGIDWWPLARDVGGTHGSGLHDTFGGIGMPITVFYDQNDRVLYVAPGAIPEPDLRAKLRELYHVQV